MLCFIGARLLCEAQCVAGGTNGICLDAMLTAVGGIEPELQPESVASPEEQLQVRRVHVLSSSAPRGILPSCCGSSLDGCLGRDAPLSL